MSLKSLIENASHSKRRRAIVAFARIETKAGTREASELSVVFAKGQEATYGPDRFDDLIKDAGEYGKLLESPELIPIIATVDGMLDLCLSWRNLCSRYRVVPIARSSSDFYSISFYDKDDEEDEEPVVVVFDMKHIMPRGIPGMSEVVGMSPDGTARGDCRIMREYARVMCRDHDSLKAINGLGSSVLTLTSMARREVDDGIGKLSYPRRKGRGTEVRTLKQDYMLDALIGAPRTYWEYAARRACMRGGYVFASARESNRLLGRVVSIDETSAHHAQAVAHYVPEEFKRRDPAWLQAAAERVVAMTVDDVLKSYKLPFLVSMHAEVEFVGLRLRPDSVFERQEIGFVSTGRFAVSEGIEGIDTEAMVEAERAIRERGFGDTVDEDDAEAAFGKIMRAGRLTTWVTELELWCMSRVYAWDRMTVLQGEAATKRKRPDDYAVLTSMHFWRNKQAAKARRDAAPYGSEDWFRLEAIYSGEVKPQFNAVGYGLHARDEFRPGWEVHEDGSWSLQPPIDEDTFEEKRPKKPRAWFNYGSRIAGWSRVHLVIAMELLFRKFGDDARLVAGDTDSLKVRTDVPEDDIVAALSPLHEATRTAISEVTSRAREMWPNDYDDMFGVGEFVAETTAENFFSSNLKQYVAVLPGGAIKVTCAGVPRDGDMSFGAWLRTMTDAWGLGMIELAMGFDVSLAPSVSQLSVIDYGATREGSFVLPSRVGVGYTFNSLTDADNRATLSWQRRHGRDVIVDPQAECSWVPAGPRFSYCDGIIDGF